jgi:hypothetical protein
MYTHRNTIVGSTSVVAVKEKELVYLFGSSAAATGVWEGASVSRAPQRLQEPTGVWNGKPSPGAATLLRLELGTHPH